MTAAIHTAETTPLQVHTQALVGLRRPADLATAAANEDPRSSRAVPGGIQRLSELLRARDVLRRFGVDRDELDEANAEIAELEQELALVPASPRGPS